MAAASRCSAQMPAITSQEGSRAISANSLGVVTFLCSGEHPKRRIPLKSRRMKSRLGDTASTRSGPLSSGSAGGNKSAEVLLSLGAEQLQARTVQKASLAVRDREATV